MLSMKDKNAVALGTKGGKSTSDRKRAAIKENLKLARLKRWPKTDELDSPTRPGTEALSVACDTASEGVSSDRVA